jgi:putative flavoprotein involved in K+ transport
VTDTVQVVVIGGGQSGLAAGYHLRRQGLDFVILDADPGPGGSWQHMWDSLHLFSPAEHSSLPGRLMPAQAGATYSDAGHVVDHLADYEKRYDLPVQHGTRVDAVRRKGERLLVEADVGAWPARAVISATGSWSRPFVPVVPGRSIFTGRQLRTPSTTAVRPTSRGSASSWSVAATPAPRSPPTWTQPGP